MTQQKKEVIKKMDETSEIYTLRMFLEAYKGFDFERGEVVVVNRNSGSAYICKYRNGELKHTYHNMSEELESGLWDWSHTENTMIVMIRKED